MIRVCVTGGRDYKNRRLVFDTLDAVHQKHGIALLIHGGADGADSLADDWAEVSGVWKEIYAVQKEEWARLGKKAGPIRNGTMLREGKPDMLIAFPGGPGTADCTRQARGLGIQVTEVS